MSSLPSKASFDGAGVTEAAFKAALDSQNDYLVALIGSTGSYGMHQAQGRLTLSTGIATTDTDVSAAVTVYFTPYKGNTIRLYDGTDWVLSVFTELSQATSDATKSPAAVAASSNYDCFVWNDAGTLRCTRGPAWTSATARGTGAGTTELEVFEGRYVNKIAITNGPAARRGLYVGSLRSNASSQINDSMALRHVWNNYNRVVRPMRAVDTTDTWAYNGAFRQANAAAANQLDFLVGLSEDRVLAEVWAGASASVANTQFGVAVGLDSTTTPLASQLMQTGHASAVQIDQTNAKWQGFPGIGRHTLVWLEFSGAATTTWVGDNNWTTQQSGIQGELLA